MMNHLYSYKIGQDKFCAQLEWIGKFDWDQGNYFFLLSNLPKFTPGLVSLSLSRNRLPWRSININRLVINDHFLSMKKLYRSRLAQIPKFL